MNETLKTENRIKNLLKEISVELAIMSQDPLYQQALEFMENRELGLAFEFFGELAIKNNVTSSSVLEKLYQIGVVYNYSAETGSSRELWNDLLKLKK